MADKPCNRRTQEFGNYGWWLTRTMFKFNENFAVDHSTVVRHFQRKIKMLENDSS